MGRLQRCVVVAFVILSGVVPAGSATAQPAGSAAGAQRIGHVWLIMLENHSYAENFGTVAKSSVATHPQLQYLADTLPSEGALLTNYFGIAHPSNSNYTALLSGQPPNIGFFRFRGCEKIGITGLGGFCTGTQYNCLYYTNFELKRTTSDGVGVGQGCVYPSSIHDIGTQLRSAQLTVKAYQEDMPKPCDHPAIGAYDASSVAPGYETGNNPFLYFDNWINHPTVCQRDDVPLNRNTFEPLVSDLQSIGTTPNLSWIGLNLCDGGHDDCPNFYPDRAKSSFFNGATVCHGAVNASERCNAQSSWFLSQLIPKITASPAYKQDGLIAIVWDEANFYTTSPYADYSACCNEPNQPGASGLNGVTGEVNLLFHKIKITPGSFKLLGAFGDSDNGVADYLKEAFKHHGLEGQPGGGDSGAILLSPFIQGGTVSNQPYNHYSLLATIQRIFGLARTGNAADPKLRPIGSDVSSVFP